MRRLAAEYYTDAQIASSLAYVFGVDSSLIHDRSYFVLEQHGAIVADNGSAWYMSGAPDERWNNDALATLRRVPGSAFDAIETSSMIADPNSGQVH